MKKLSKIMVSLALVLILVMPMFLGGCFLFDKDEESIKINTEFKTEYIVGETLDVTGGILYYTDNQGKTIQVVIQENMISGFSSETAGTRNMVVTYKGLTTVVAYTVSPEFFDTTGIYRWEQFNGSTDMSVNILFAKPNVIKISQGAVNTDYFAEGTYTKSLVNGAWVVTFTMTATAQSPGYTTMSGTISNITFNSIKFTFHTDTNAKDNSLNMTRYVANNAQ